MQIGCLFLGEMQGIVLLPIANVHVCACVHASVD